MNEQEMWSGLSNRKHNESIIEHQFRMGILDDEASLNFFRLLKPKVTIDGNMYCVLYGENLQEGIAGFGETLMKAIYDFNKQFRDPIKINPDLLTKGVKE